MPVPDFQTLMRPLLEEYASGNERPIAEVRAALAVQFALTEEELAERLPSGGANACSVSTSWGSLVRAQYRPP
jgi:restriction system protein